MTITDVQTHVEEIAQTMVMMDPANAVNVAEVGRQLGELVGVLRDAGRAAAAVAAENAAALVADCAGQGEVPAAVLATLNQVIETLQECLAQPPGAMAPSEPSAASGGEAVDNGLTLSPLVDEAIVAEFLSRQSDALGDIEKLILTFEKQASDDAMEELKRWFHTLKGEAGLLGLSAVADLCHATEDMIQAESPSACVDRLLAVMDWLQSCFHFLIERGPEPTAAAALMEQLRTPAAAVVPTPQAPPQEIGAEPEITGETTGGEKTGDQEIATGEAAASEPGDARYELPEVALPDYTGKNLLEGDVGLLQDFIAEAGEHLDAAEAHLLTIEADPHAAEALNAVFRGFHTIKGLAGFAELDHIQELAHKAENLLDMARKGEIDLRGGAMDLVFESVDMMKRLVEGVVTALAAGGCQEEVAELPSLVARLIAATPGGPIIAGSRQPAPEPALPPPPVPAAAAAASRVGKSGFVPLANMAKRAAGAKPAAAAPAVTASPPAPAPRADAAPQPAVEPPAGGDDDDGGSRAAPRSGGPSGAVKVKEAVRVDAERLDRLIETIGEMVIAESMVSQSPEVRRNLSVKLAKDLDHLDKISRELQEIGMSLRMVPVRPVFQKMARLVRDLAKKTNRQVEFVMSGEDTELDKNVVDKIGDPLVHMVRNAVDHGLEPTAAERRAAGKSETGRIELRAFHKGGNICIEIEDDGRGLPRDKIIAKAIERGLIREGDVLTDRDIHGLIFEPGFSTATKVTDISGRGVGMDVVRRNIEELRGTCEIQSESGKGSTFTIKLPLTLAIIEGMVSSCGTEHYIVPTLSVVRLVRPTAADISLVFDRGEMLAFEDEHLPLFRLGQLFNVATAKQDPADAVVVVVEDEGRKIGLLADDLLGQQSIVIKSLGESMQDTEGVAGGAIMSNGNVALILDVAGLIRVAHATTTALSAREGAAEPAAGA